MNPMSFEAVKSFLSAAHQSDRRSTVLQPLNWLTAILVAGVVSLSATGAQAWLLVVFAVGLAVLVVCYLVAYWFFAKTNPEMLRSEQFSLRKMEIERGYVGDNLSGLSHPTADGRPVLPPPRVEGRP